MLLEERVDDGDIDWLGVLCCDAELDEVEDIVGLSDSDAVPDMDGDADWVGDPLNDFVADIDDVIDVVEDCD